MSKGQVILFILLDYSEPKFVGLAWEREFNDTILEFRRTKPPFMVQVVDKFDNLYSAQAAARPLIKRYLTNMFGWNETDFGDLDNKPRVNPGGYKLPHRVGTHKDEKYDALRRSISEKISVIARENDHASRLPYLAGDTHPNKKEENRQKISKSVTGRRKYILPDGTWTWCYSKNHPMAYKNRDRGISHLEDLPPSS